MEGLNTQALRGFSLKCFSVSREKSNYICNTDKGYKIIQKVYTSYENILFQHQVKETLYQNGFKNTDRFILSQSGKPYVIWDNDLYVATDYIPPEYKEADFCSKDTFLASVSAVAKMHSILKNSGIGNLGICMYVKKKDSIEDLHKKHMADLKYYKKITSKQSRLSDFDVMFLKSYDFYTESLSQWKEIALSKQYSDVIEDGYANCYVCHNILKEETILSTADNKIFISNFSECSILHFVNDLSSLIKRYLKYMPSEPASLSEIIDCYNNANPMTNAELSALNALLIFPDKFLKLCSRYYSKRRTWIPAAFLSRMENITDNKERQSEYICGYFKRNSL